MAEPSRGMGRGLAALLTPSTTAGGPGDRDLAQPVLVARAREDRGEAPAHPPAVIGHEHLAYDLFPPHALDLFVHPRAATSFANLRYAALPAL